MNPPPLDLADWLAEAFPEPAAEQPTSKPVDPGPSNGHPRAGEGGNGRPLHSRRPDAVDRARAFILKMKMSVQGQHGSRTLMSALRCIVDGFGITDRASIRSAFDHYNSERCQPPWSDKDVERAIDNTLKNFPHPSCKHLNAEPKDNAKIHNPAYGEAPIEFDYSEHGPSANGDGHASQAGGGHAAGNGQKVDRWPVGAKVHASDQDNIGTITADHGGDKVQVHFVSPSGREATKWLPRSHLTLLGAAGSTAGDAAVAEPFDLGLIDSKTLAESDFHREFIVQEILVDRQPCVVGGPRKALKTSLCVALALAIAAGEWFLGRFRVPRARKVLFLSGESGESTLQETARRIAAGMGINLATLAGNLIWGFTLPKLSRPDHLAKVTEAIREHQIEVVFIDPLYLCLISGGNVNPSNLFDMGPLLMAISRACLDAGATPILVHHLRKNTDDPFGPPELEDLAFAGIQEFARQWLLLGRRSAHVPGTGQHELWLLYGGSAGHGGSWALDVSEGVADENLQGRHWSIELNPAGEVRDQARVQRELTRQKAKDEAERLKADTDATEATVFLRKNGPNTARGLRPKLGWGQARTDRAIARAQGLGWITETEVQVRKGKGVHAERGFRAGPDPSQPNRPEPAHAGSSQFEAGSRTGTAHPPLIGGEPDRFEQASSDHIPAPPGEPVGEPELDADGFAVDPPF